MQKIFSQELRFKDENGQEFPDWKEDVLGNIFDHKKGTGLSGKELDKDGSFHAFYMERSTQNMTK